MRDKEIVELAQAWQQLCLTHTDLYLVIVGEQESFDPVPPAVIGYLQLDPYVHLVGYVAEPASYFAMFDSLVFPTHREGFGLVALEASAMERPVVATQVAGVVDAVVHDETGVLVDARDSGALATAIMEYLAAPDRRKRHGVAGRQRALDEFVPEKMWRALPEHYDV